MRKPKSSSEEPSLFAAPVETTADDQTYTHDSNHEIPGCGQKVVIERTHHVFPDTTELWCPQCQQILDRVHLPPADRRRLRIARLMRSGCSREDAERIFAEQELTEKQAVKTRKLK